jgi:serine protease
MRNRLVPWVFLMVAVGGVYGFWRSAIPNPKASETPGASAEQDAEAAAASDFDLVVDYRDDIGQATLDATPFTEEPVSSFTSIDKLYRVRFDTEAEARSAIASLRGNPAVESVDWDVPAALPPDEAAAEAQGPPSVECATSESSDDASTATKGFPNDPCYQYQWHLRQIGLPDAWKLGQGKGVVVAVIDTGVTAVPDLGKAHLVDGYNFVANNANAADDHGHGTHVAGTIAQITNNGLGVAGVAFEAKIMPLKVLSAQGSGTMAAIAQAIRYAADHGAQVINMSLGGPLPTNAIRNAVKYARSKGTLVVAAAGNDGRGRVSYPARYPEVLAVAATQFDETTTFYSNWGAAVDIAAPGGNVRVDQNGDGKPDGVLQNTVVPGNIQKTDYLWFMGTSMASPHVAGVAALVVGAGVNRPEAVEEILRGTARRPRASEAGEVAARVDDHYGAGIVDAGAALRKARGGRGAGGLALGFSLALLGLSGLRRRGQLGKLGVGLPAGIVLGASGLFFLPWLVSLPSALSFLQVGVTEMVPATFAGFGQGSPLLFSVVIPLAAAALLSGVPRLRPALAGLAFGVAGALAFLAISASLDVRFVPDVLDRAWLAVNAAACTVLGAAVLRR